MNKRPVAVLLFALLGLAGCKPKPGGSCKTESRETCADGAKALVCVSGKWLETPCRGPKGCSGAGEASSCDDDVAVASEACGLDGDFACTQDKTAYLTCKAHAWVAAGTCRGPKGCFVHGTDVNCDATYARAGDACGKEGSHACTDDKKSALVCKTGKFVLSTKCSGPDGCTVKDDEVACDDSFGETGDTCETPNRYACAKDGRSILVCKDGKLAKDEDCPKKKACKILGGAQVGCV